MAETTIGDNHRDLVMRYQHVLEWLQRERARLDSELQHVTAQGQRTQAEMLTFLGQTYGVDVRAPLTIDADRGVIITPDAEPAPEPVAHDQSGPAPTPITRHTRARRALH